MIVAGNRSGFVARRAGARIVTALVLAVVPALLPVAAPASAASPTVEREWGASRYATAVAVSKMTFPTPGVPLVYVATGTNFPDALAAGAAAASGGRAAPPCTTERRAAETAAELDRLNPAKIVIAGGTAAVTPAVAAQLAQYAPVVTRAWVRTDTPPLPTSRSRASRPGLTWRTSPPDAISPMRWRPARQPRTAVALCCSSRAAMSRRRRRTRLRR